MHDKDEPFPPMKEWRQEHFRRHPSRRSFLQAVAAGVVVLVPALRSLIQPSAAQADPPHAHCAKKYVKFLYQKCVGTRMIAYYETRCSVCWYVCSTFSDDNGPCPQ